MRRLVVALVIVLAACTPRGIDAGEVVDAGYQGVVCTTVMAGKVPVTTCQDPYHYLRLEGCNADGECGTFRVKVTEAIAAAAEPGDRWHQDAEGVWVGGR